jgi:hypothetical protein
MQYHHKHIYVNVSEICVIINRKMMKKSELKIHKCIGQAPDLCNTALLFSFFLRH